MSGNLLVFSSRALQAVQFLGTQEDTQRLSSLDAKHLWRVGGKKPSMREMRQEIDLSLRSEKVLSLKTPVEKNQSQSAQQLPENSLAPLLWLKKMMQTLPKCVVDPSASTGNTESEVPRSRYKH